MHPAYTFTNPRSQATDLFNQKRIEGCLARAWAELTGKSSHLEPFPEHVHAELPNRKFLGVRDISPRQVVGSLGRVGDFDRKFRPLKRNLLARWVNLYLISDIWEPILVYKVGEKYYVEDGHHRLSVARALGRAFIQAIVWEYPVSPCQEASKPQTRPVKKPSRVPVVQT